MIISGMSLIKTFAFLNDLCNVTDTMSLVVTRKALVISKYTVFLIDENAVATDAPQMEWLR